jgi:hypothetical protein
MSEQESKKLEPRVLNDVASWPPVESYQTAKPFPHAVIDDFLRREIAEQLSRVFPDPSAECWYRYANPLERKLACNIPGKVPPKIWETLEFFNSDECLKLFGRLTGIEDLKADQELHGGGMHCIAPGGKLDIHIDYSIHPKLGLERRLNLILYLNRDWNESWGGQLELWDDTMSRCVRKIAPIFNRAVIFDTGDGSYHGHPDALQCPEEQSRKSLAVYYLTAPRGDAAKRYRARFVARPEDPKDDEIEELRRLRSGLTTGTTVYRVGVRQ